MRQRDDAGRVRSPVAYRRRHRRMARTAQEMSLRILADEQRELDPPQLGEQPIEPQLRALAPRRQVATGRRGPGSSKPIGTIATQALS